MYIKSGKIKSVIKKAAAAALSLVLFFILAACGTLAWFEKEDESEADIDFSSMEIKSRVYFAGLADSDPLNRHDDDGFYRAEVVQAQSGAGNYYGNLRIDILFRGIGANYVRISIEEMWCWYDSQALENVITRNVFTPFLFNGSLWIDNRKSGDAGMVNDGYFYYCDESVDPAAGDPYEISYAPSGAGDYRVISLITGINPEWLARQNHQAGTFLLVKVLAKAVQANRYLEIWNDIEALPGRD